MIKPKIPRGLPKSKSGMKDKAWSAFGLGKEMRDALNKSLERRGQKIKLSSNYGNSKSIRKLK